ncbi:ATP-dependent DNA helicase [Aphis craccivora]|uniref:ATP-dependent DNA helicase n=1 Tax=Aphis craccivora TaxID=307492 RepID=A0A6G0Y095_APHCR|nr:ATP-dependent DNA helicase [Aphis craccivora]
MSVIENKEDGVIFVNALGGIGKTFLMNLILAEIRLKGDIAVVVASSGVAATLLKGGRTAHSMFKLPLNLNSEEPFCNIVDNPGTSELLKETKVIIWDECTMPNKKAPEALHTALQD